jgi:hypothetical protein
MTRKGIGLREAAPTVVREPSRKKTGWWKQKSMYGSGNHGMLVNAQIFDPEFLDGRFTWNEIAFLLTLTFKAWKDGDWRILATEDFIRAGLEGRGIESHGSIKRFKRKWIEAGYLKLVHYGGLGGNEYLVSSVLLATHTAETMRHYHDARALVQQARAREKKAQAEAEAHRAWLHAERQKQQREWANACRAARQAGKAEPPIEQYVSQ